MFFGYGVSLAPLLTQINGAHRVQHWEDIYRIGSIYQVRAKLLGVLNVITFPVKSDLLISFLLHQVVKNKMLIAIRLENYIKKRNTPTPKLRWTDKNNNLFMLAFTGFVALL